MDHYARANEILSNATGVNDVIAAIAHGLLAVVDALRDDDEDLEVNGYQINPAVLAEFLRPIKKPDIKDGLL